MRVPHLINPNTAKAYDASIESLKLIGEDQRQLVSEVFDWDNEHCPSLPDLCVEAISRNFEQSTLLHELPCPDLSYLVEILPLGLPLEMTVPLIDDEFYWRRKYEDKFGTNFRPLGDAWKKSFIKRTLEERIEQAEPQYQDELAISEELDMYTPFIDKLKIRQLQNWNPPLTWDEEDIPDKYPIDHIDFGPIFEKLTEIEEFDLVFGMKEVGDKFKWDFFRLSALDCQKLGRAVQHLLVLKTLRIHNSNLMDDHIRGLCQGLIKNLTVEELDLSHCQVGDDGAMCLAKVLTVHPCLRKLDLTDNRIRKKGAEALSFAILQPDCVLNSLILRLNPLGSAGVLAIMGALMRVTWERPEEVSLSGTQIGEEAAVKFGRVVHCNMFLEILDISSNYFGEAGGQALIDGLAFNKTLKWMDTRNTHIPTDMLLKIKERLRANRKGIDLIDESDEEVDEEEVLDEFEEELAEEVAEEDNEDEEHVKEPATEPAKDEKDAAEVTDE